jgi:hypothetical protein
MSHRNLLARHALIPAQATLLRGGALRLRDRPLCVVSLIVR